MTCELWEQRLDAYVDGEASSEESRDLERHLQTCRACAAEALGRMQLKRETRAAATMRYSPSAELRARVEKSMGAKRKRASFWMSPALAIAVAAILVLTIGVSTALFVQRSARDQEIAQLLDIHVAALASPNPVDVVSSDRHTVKPWFQGKLPFTFNLPEMAGSRYSLRGGRLVYFQGQPGAQLIYEAGKHEISVFILGAGKGSGTGPSAETRNGFSAESWNAGGLRYVVMSDAGAGEVHALADLLRAVQHS